VHNYLQAIGRKVPQLGQFLQNSTEKTTHSTDIIIKNYACPRKKFRLC